MNYADHVSERQTPQSEPIPGKAQVQNSAGGYSFAVDDWKRLDRFLILGSEGGSYYASERKLTIENAEALKRCVATDGRRVVQRVVEISRAGRAPKNDPAILALALCAKKGDEATRRAAYAALPEVCRIGTHLMHFAEYAQAFGGWGRGMKRAVGDWYLKRSDRSLAEMVVKYQQRDGWSNRDLLRLSKPKGASGTQNEILRWATKGWDSVGDEPHPDEVLRHIWAFERCKRAETSKEVARLVHEHRLPRECVPTEHLNSAEVWEALLPHMKPEALVRNLAKMTTAGFLAPLSEAALRVSDMLVDVDAIKRARLHPIKVLAALCTYSGGHGIRGSLTWTPVQSVVDALDRAFYLAFGAVEPSGKRTLLALDVSGSMESGECGGVIGLTPRVGSAAMALVTAATEKNHAFVAFTSRAAGEWRYGSGQSAHYGYYSGLTEVAISPKHRLDAVCEQVRRMPMGGTDCALPMLWAAERKVPVDTFTIYTDFETWAGNVHPVQALKMYRDKMGIAAKLVVVGMVANEFTIADPNDAGMLDVVGFDTAVPQVISDFARD